MNYSAKTDISTSIVVPHYLIPRWMKGRKNVKLIHIVVTVKLFSNQLQCCLVNRYLQQPQICFKCKNFHKKGIVFFLWDIFYYTVKSSSRRNYIVILNNTKIGSILHVFISALGCKIKHFLSSSNMNILGLK